MVRARTTSTIRLCTSVDEKQRGFAPKTASRILSSYFSDSRHGLDDWIREGEESSIQYIIIISVDV